MSSPQAPPARGNLPASILARLLTLARQRGEDYNLLLGRFGLERLLARISASAHADRFLLKGYPSNDPWH